MRNESIEKAFTAALGVLVEQVKEDRSVLAAILCGSLSHDTVWEKSDIDLLLVTVDEAKPATDGIAMDAEGAIWASSPFTNETIRVKQGGEVTERIATEQMSIACALGGADRKTLFVLTAPTTDPEKCRANPASRIEITQVEVPGAGFP